MTKHYKSTIQFSCELVNTVQFFLISEDFFLFKMDQKKANKRTLKALTKNSPKRKKTADYNVYFIEQNTAEKKKHHNMQSQTEKSSVRPSFKNHDKNLLSEEKEVPLSSGTPEQFSPKRASCITERSAEEVKLSYKDLSEMVSDMFTMAQVMMEELKDATAKIHSYRTNSMLAISNTEISLPVGDPVLEMFEKYELPIKSKEELEKLESDLDGSQDFLKFFVSNFCCRNTQISIF